MCATRGPGILVLPTQGPVMVRCLEFSRVHAKDKMGYIAHSRRFVREGASTALASVSNLINMIFIQAETAANIAAQVFAATSLIKEVPDYVQQALQLGTETSLATLEAVRTSTDVDPTVNAQQRDAINAAYDAIPQVLANEDAVGLQAIGQSIVDIAMALTENMTPEVALQSMVEILEATPIVVSSSSVVNITIWSKQVETNMQVSSTILRVAALISYCEAIANAALGDRRAAITLRAKVSNYFEAQLENLQSEQYDLYHSMIKLRDATVEYLSRAIIDLAPVVRVSAGNTMPSLFWAWRLYADPNRASELVARNVVPHPSFMPTKFEALGK
jgi:prophage DNA circulation protein